MVYERSPYGNRNQVSGYSVHFLSSWWGACSTDAAPAVSFRERNVGARSLQPDFYRARQHDDFPVCCPHAISGVRRLPCAPVVWGEEYRISAAERLFLLHLRWRCVAAMGWVVAEHWRRRRMVCIRSVVGTRLFAREAG